MELAAYSWALLALREPVAVETLLARPLASWEPGHLSQVAWADA